MCRLTKSEKETIALTNESAGSWEVSTYNSQGTMAASPVVGTKARHAAFVPRGTGTFPYICVHR